MRADTITHVVPHADPDFLRIVEKMPEPPPGAYQTVISILPELHACFLKKRQAAKENNPFGFKIAVDAELALLERLGQAA